MRIETSRYNPTERGSILAYFAIVVVLLTTLASVTAYVAQSMNAAHRRDDMVQALQIAEGGASIACEELNRALTNKTSSMLNNLATLMGYCPNPSLSTAFTNVFQRTMTAPYTNQTVTAQIWMTNTDYPRTAMVIAQAKVQSVTQTAITHVQIKFGYGAAILDDKAGTDSTGVSKGIAQGGNVVINGDKSGPTIVDGGEGWAILANGRANVDTSYATVPDDSISMTNRNSIGQIPDYTDEGSRDQLFQFDRFIAVADLTPGGPSPSGNNHFTNLASFIAAAKNLGTKFFEGVVVVDISRKEMGGLSPTDFPNGINVHGTLFVNFASDVSPSDKIINTAAMNINPADLSGLNPTDPATYPTGFPPVYQDPKKNPVNIDITSKGFPNFEPQDDLPAVMYNIGILDMHGNVNISGVVYTPSFMEIENKQDNQIQYFKGSLIAGDGVYFENTHRSTSIASLDPNALDNLATSHAKGKVVVATFWE